MKHYDVLIVGAGIVGLSAALSMAMRGFKVAIFDKQLDLQDSCAVKGLRVYAINETSKTLFSSLGVWKALHPEAVSPYKKMHIWDALNGEKLEFDARFIASTELGNIVYESSLKRVLIEALKRMNNIDCIQAQVYVEENTKELGSRVLSDGTNHWQGKLLIVADGRDSPLREQFKVPLHQENYHQSALIATVQTEKPHEKTAYQIFQKDGPLAFLPLIEPNQCSIVWSSTPEAIRELKAMPVEAFNEALTQAFQDRLGSVILKSERQSFPLMMRHVAQYVGTNWLLMGDAAHTIHPLAGLGLNLGLADLNCWLKLLDDNKNFTSTKVLQAYQRERKCAVWKVIILMSGINRIFKNHFAPFIALRGLGLRITNQFPGFKRLLIEEARGNL